MGREISPFSSTPVHRDMNPDKEQELVVVNQSSSRGEPVIKTLRVSSKLEWPRGSRDVPTSVSWGPVDRVGVYLLRL